jgi:hypothetical protein
VAHAEKGVMNRDGQSRKAAQAIKLLIAVQLTPDWPLCPHGHAPTIVAQLRTVVKPADLAPLGGSAVSGLTAMVRAALPLQVPRLASAPLVFFGLAASGLVRACSEWVQARLPGAM